MIMGNISVFITKQSAKQQLWIKKKQHFLKEFKATCENSSESELKQQQAIWLGTEHFNNNNNNNNNLLLF